MVDESFRCFFFTGSASAAELNLILFVGGRECVQYYDWQTLTRRRWQSTQTVNVQVCSIHFRMRIEATIAATSETIWHTPAASANCTETFINLKWTQWKWLEDEWMQNKNAGKINWIADMFFEIVRVKWAPFIAILNSKSKMSTICHFLEIFRFSQCMCAVCVCWVKAQNVTINNNKRAKNESTPMRLNGLKFCTICTCTAARIHTVFTRFIRLLLFSTKDERRLFISIQVGCARRHERWFPKSDLWF